MENIKTNVWKTGLVVLGALAAFVILLSIAEIKSIFNIGSEAPATSTVTVSGKGEQFSVPDIATFSFTVSEFDKTVAAAQKKATDKQNAATKALLDSGIDKNDIQTQGYSINPHTEYQEGLCVQNSVCRPGKSVITGYDVSQTTEVKVHDFDKAGKTLDLVGGLGVSNVNGLTFSIDKVDAVKEKARSAAIDDAKQKAEKLADELGVRLVKIVKFQEDTSPYQPMYMDSMVMKSSVAPQAASPEISAGQQKITSNVTITYEIR
ncbi:MAG: hypothetical protein JWO73_406 [Candidatus Taylorbacteria bacterium]|nr:hypothetical protein [Candidatus Taylorbacteria bacterium]